HRATQWARCRSRGCRLDALDGVSAMLVKKRMRLAPRHQRDEPLQLHAQMKEPQPPPKFERRLWEHVPGEDGDDRAMDLERTSAVHEKLAKRLLVVRADQAPEDRRAADDEFAISA